MDYVEDQDWKPVRRIARGRLMGLCPLHADRKPSFLLDPNQNLFYCYGCGRGGDVIRFAELYHGVPFGEAIALLRRWSGVGTGAPRYCAFPAALIELDVRIADIAGACVSQECVRHGRAWECLRFLLRAERKRRGRCASATAHNSTPIVELVVSRFEIYTLVRHGPILQVGSLGAKTKIKMIKRVLENNCAIWLGHTICGPLPKDDRPRKAMVCPTQACQ